MHARKTGALIRAAATAGAVMVARASPGLTPSTRPLRNSVSHFRSSTTCWMSKGRRRTWGRQRQGRGGREADLSCVVRLATSKKMARECLERAAATLQRVDLADSRLLQIGRWIVERSN